MRFTAIILCSIVLVIAVVIPALSAGADEADDFIKEVIRGARTDSQRSAKLMEAVSMTDGNAKLQLALLEKAVEYGMRSLRTADDCLRVQKAASLLAGRVPEKESFWIMQQAKVARRMQTLAKTKAEKAAISEKIVELLVQAGEVAAKKGDWVSAYDAYSEARTTATRYKLLVRDNLTARVRTVLRLAKAVELVDKYDQTLKTRPDDVDARSKIVRTLLVTLDDPARAAKYVNEDSEPKYQSYVPLAGKEASEVPLEGCKSLGEWYSKELARSMVSLDKHRMLKRAKLYYERALELHGKADIASAAMKHQISQIESDLDKLRPADPLICVYCLGGGKTACGACLVKGKSTGKLQCDKCSSTGRMKCEKCNGIFGLKCKGCAGKGYIYVMVKGYYGKYRTTRTCKICSGEGNVHYSVKYKRYRSGKCSSCNYNSPKGSDVCDICDGGGGKKPCPKCDGAKTLRCTHCQ